MIKNYIKIAWRSILKNRFFSLLNILGLAISLSVAILLLTYGRQELNFDKHFSKESNIYRIYMQTTPTYNNENWVQLPNAVAPTMLAEVPEVKSAARLVKLDFTGTASIRVNESNFMENNIYLADSALFNVFDFKFIEGNSKTVFSNPKSVVIAQSKKELLFGNQEALNKEIVFNQRDTMIVSGVFQDLPLNSSIEGDIFTNIMDSWMGKDIYWSNASYETYCLLSPTANADQVAHLTTALINKHVPADEQYYTQFFLQPLAKVHLYSGHLKHDASSRIGNINTVKTIFILASLIIAIACINYMNLATARSQKNAKEVGVSKVLGAKPYEIKLRFYLETAIVSLISIVIGLLLACALLTTFNNMIGTSINIASLLSLGNLAVLLCVWLAVTLIGGSYPAFYMARIPSLSLMKKWDNKNLASELIRRGLVVFQFTCSIILIIGVLVISLQMKHIQDKDLGYKPTQILTIPMRAITKLDKYESIKQSLLSISGTESISTLQTYPGFGESGKTINKVGSITEGLPVRTCSSRGEVVQTMGLDLLAGSDLPQNISPNDTVCYTLINEVVASYLGFSNPADAIGQPLKSEMMKKSVIVGVVRNFNFSNLKDAIGGYIYYRMNNPSESYRYFVLRYNTANTSTYLDQVRAVFAKEQPEVAFDYQFMDDYIRKQYEVENRTNKVISAFSILTIFVASLGLFGLAAFTAEQRKKEIGVRKVLGASTYKIVKLLSGHFVLLVILSLIIASPIAWWLFSKWLQDFTFRIQIPWWVFLSAGALALIIAMFTIGYQAMRAARVNPVNSLRDE